MMKTTDTSLASVERDDSKAPSQKAERLFLSGEADPDARRESLVKKLGVGAVSSHSAKNDVESGVRSAGLKIEVLDERSAPPHDLSRTEKDVNDDDDGPPPIDFAGATANIIDTAGDNRGATAVEGCPRISQSNGTKTSKDEEAPSLMDEMMADAAKARAEKERVAREAERKQAKKASFGLKKGFLSSSSETTRKNKSRTAKKTDGTKSQRKSASDVEEPPPLVGAPAGNMASSAGRKKGGTPKKSGFQRGFLNSSPKQKLRPQNNGGVEPPSSNDDVFELDSSGNMIKASQKSESIPTVSRQNKSASFSGNNPLRFEEVQEAMRKNPLENVDEWATPDLMDKVASNPRLAAGMSSPKFTAALESLQKDPKRTMEKFKEHPEVIEFLNEFCGVMGDHFTKLGAEQEKRRSKIQQEVNRAGENDVGPLAEQAVRRHKEREAKGDTCNEMDEGMSRDEKAKLDSILSNDEITKLLMDADFQRIIQECGVPGRMQMYMHHPDHGPKLRKLMEAGLLKIER